MNNEPYRELIANASGTEEAHRRAAGDQTGAQAVHTCMSRMSAEGLIDMI